MLACAAHTLRSSEVSRSTTSKTSQARSGSFSIAERGANVASTSGEGAFTSRELLIMDTPIFRTSGRHVKLLSVVISDSISVRQSYDQATFQAALEASLPTMLETMTQQLMPPILSAHPSLGDQLHQTAQLSQAVQDTANSLRRSQQDIAVSCQASMPSAGITDIYYICTRPLCLLRISAQTYLSAG